MESWDLERATPLELRERAVRMISSSVGTVSDAYDNTLAESVIGLSRPSSSNRAGPGWYPQPANGFANETGRDVGDDERYQRRSAGPSHGERDAPGPRRDSRPGCAFGIAVLVDGQVGVTADDGQAEDAGGRLVVLVVSGALGADGDVPEHALIVRQACLAAHGGSGMAARPLPPGFSGRAYVHAGYALSPPGPCDRAGTFVFVPAPPLQTRAILVHLPPK
jgi:hypothetical protein